MNSKNPLIRKTLSILLLGLSLVYLVKAVLIIDLTKLKFSDPGLMLKVLSGCVVSYSIFFSLLAVGWKLILDRIAYPNEIDFKDVYVLYTRTNLMKYLPGNVMEWVGRNVLGTKYGLTHGQIIISSLLETIIILAISGLFSLFVLMEGAWSAVHHFGSGFYLTIGITSVIAVFVCSYYLPQIKNLYSKFLPTIQQIASRRFIKVAAKVALLHSFVFFNLGVAFVAIIHYIFGFHVDNYTSLMIISAFCFSWVLGFITPGAPGGIGVKEALLLFTLAPICGAEVVILAGALHRLVSIAGDGLAWIFAQTYSMYVSRRG